MNRALRLRGIASYVVAAGSFIIASPTVAYRSAPRDGCQLPPGVSSPYWECSQDCSGFTTDQWITACNNIAPGCCVQGFAGCNDGGLDCWDFDDPPGDTPAEWFCYLGSCAGGG